MASVVFDNSTLSAVQRLTGTAPAPNWYDAQGDYAALENFVCSLIFYDDFYFVDDTNQNTVISADRCFHTAGLSVPKRFRMMNSRRNPSS